MRGKLKVFKCCVWSIVNCVSRFDGNTELQNCLQEASLISFQMRFLFAPICAFYYPKNLQLICAKIITIKVIFKTISSIYCAASICHSDLEQYKLIYAKNIALKSNDMKNITALVFNTVLESITNKLASKNLIKLLSLKLTIIIDNSKIRQNDLYLIESE
jgi:hypothetical protein